MFSACDITEGSILWLLLTMALLTMALLTMAPTHYGSYSLWHSTYTHYGSTLTPSTLRSRKAQKLPCSSARADTRHAAYLVRGRGRGRVTVRARVSWLGLGLGQGQG